MPLDVLGHRHECLTGQVMHPSSCLSCVQTDARRFVIALRGTETEAKQDRERSDRDDRE
jgi:hypothetical protein